jgi:phosphoglycolate phosphatase-like HAD superfamily hydrolase
MKYHTNNFNSIIFDCDGVLLNSNKVKTQAFYNVALSYGEEYANILTDYHVKNGGISRNQKFKYFLDKVIPSGVSGPDIEELIYMFSIEVKKGLLECEVSPCLPFFRRVTDGVKWFVVSGGAQDELKEVFQIRGIYNMFDGGIYGSPKSKDDILKALISSHTIKFPSLFLGDSMYDYEVATRANIDFIFVSGWSEFKNWSNYCKAHKIKNILSICEIVTNY